MIRKLPPEVINQIAAGEVVERPASVVKELVENSLDAGALRIRIEIHGGGAESIRILDDGVGFAAADLPLAFASHATSKLATVADLDHIASLGFRGEALASIGAVSRATIRSRQAAAAEGWLIRSDGGAEQAPEPCGCPLGTQIEVRDLFYNVPARRRFLKSAAAERARIQEMVAELALARLEVDFCLLADGRELLRLPAGESLAARFARCFGQELARGLLPVERGFAGLQVQGVIAEPDLARRDSKLELCFVNGRLARENSAVQAIRQAYREYLMGGRWPVYALQLVMPPDQVDVNVHPRKAEVRFVEPRKVAGCLHEVVRQALQARGLASSSGGIVVAAELPRAKSGFPDLPSGLFADRLPLAGAVPPAEPVLAQPAQVREPPPPHRPDAGALPPPPPVQRPNPFARASGRYLQVMDLYLLLETPDGLLVVDQHALHERVVYEQLRAQHRNAAVQMQRLLVPVVVEVTPSEMARALALREAWAAEGLLVDAFGPAALAVQGLPSLLARVDAGKLLRVLLAGEQEPPASALREQIAERFHSMACRSAVMRGDRLEDAEIAALLQAAASLDHPHNCPHGRPTVLTFTSAELERYFRRRC